MELKLVNSEQASDLEYFGFPIECLDIIDETYRNGVKNNVPEGCYVSENYWIRKCPTLELAAKWLRKIKHIDIMIVPLCLDFNEGSKTNFETPDAYEARLIKNGQEICVTYYCDSYEDALSAGIDEALKLL